MSHTDGIILVLGGTRSGKSDFAESLARQTSLKRLYLATSQAFDDEMENRIAKHQISRGDDWQTIEEPLDIAHILKKEAAPDRVILVDCLTLWISNLMMAEKDLEQAFSLLCQCLEALKGPVIFVSNEVGQGIVPDNKMARDFRDHAGQLHQRIAAAANSVYFITAGLPQKLK
ncbi:MAG: bifunctional adenosylcobinamide kinase/adenosylcobinamide-phosphate guanylyltransferase [Sneathiella sp.]